MKKFLVVSIAFLSLLAFSTVQGQGTYKALTPTKTSLSNVDTADLLVTPPALKYTTATFTVTVVKGTGTVAGTVVLEGSNNGIKYGLIGTNTYTLTDIAEKVKAFAIIAPETGFRYYRIRVLTTGTVTATVPSGTVYFR